MGEGRGEGLAPPLESTRRARSEAIILRPPPPAARLHYCYFYWYTQRDPLRRREPPPLPLPPPLTAGGKKFIRKHSSLHRPEFFRSTPPLTLGKTLSYCVTGKRERFTRAVYHECKGKQTLLITQNCVGMVILQGFKLYEIKSHVW